MPLPGSQRRRRIRPGGLYGEVEVVVLAGIVSAHPVQRRMPSGDEVPGVPDGEINQSD